MGTILPMALPTSSTTTSSQECLTIADSPGRRSLADLERCAVVVTDDLELLADLGAAYETAGRVPDAERTYRQIIARDDDYADMHVRLARLLLARGDHEGARRHLNRALQTQPNRASIRSLLDTVDHP